jgi:predicted dehydrogenase
VLHLLGRPRSVFAQGYERISGSVDRVHAMWHYDDGPMVHVEGYWDMPPSFGFNMGFTAVFEKGAVVWDMITGQPLTVHRPGADPETPTVPAEEGYYAEIEYFLRCIERGEDPKTSTPQESRDAVAIALAEKQSALTGSSVTID